MKFFLVERMLLLELLPTEGDYAALKELRKTREMLGLTADEEKKFNVKHEDGMMTWNPEGNSVERDIPLSEWATTTFQEELRKRNTEKKLDNRTFSLYEKFVVAYDQV